MPPGIRESDFQELVRRAALGAGCRYFHDQDSRMNDAGFPDTVICTPGGLLVFAELKTATGALTPDQRAWLDALAAVERLHVGWFRPADAAKLSALIYDQEVPRG